MYHWLLSCNVLNFAESPHCDTIMIVGSVNCVSHSAIPTPNDHNATFLKVDTWYMTTALPRLCTLYYIFRKNVPTNSNTRHIVSAMQQIIYFFSSSTDLPFTQKHSVVVYLTDVLKCRRCFLNLTPPSQSMTACVACVARARHKGFHNACVVFSSQIAALCFHCSELKHTQLHYTHVYRSKTWVNTHNLRILVCPL